MRSRCTRSLRGAGPAHAATTFTVNSTADAPDAFTTSNTCDTEVLTGGVQCTLRAAIKQANATAGAEAINLSIPSTGVKTIAVGSTGLGSLPTITDPVTTSGYTQPGSSPNTKVVGNDAVLKIELSGNGQISSGLDITHVSGSSVVRHGNYTDGKTHSLFPGLLSWPYSTKLVEGLSSELRVDGVLRS